MFQFNHFNFNVLNLEKSLEFYKEALGLDVVREKDASDGSFKIVYLGDGSSDFLFGCVTRKNLIILGMKSSIWL